MKAVFCKKYGGPDVLTIKEIEISTPKQDEILVKNYASSVTTADTFLRRGEPKFGRLFLGLFKHKNPRLGTGFAGVVTQVGENITDYKVGDKLYGETGFAFAANAEYVCFNPKKGVVQYIPDGLSFKEASPICDGALTSYNFLVDMAKIEANQQVLIIGASGALGTAAVQIAKSMGAKVTAVCSEKNNELVKGLGADEIIDYNKQDFTKNLNTYDIIYDTIGINSFGNSKKALKRNGMYLSPVLNLSLLCTMMSTSVFGKKKAKFQATGLRKPDELNEFLLQIHKLIKNKEVKTVIDRTYTIDEIVAAHEYVDSGRKRGNVVLVFED